MATGCLLSVKGRRKAISLLQQLVKRWDLCLRTGKWGINTGEREWPTSEQQKSRHEALGVLYARRTQRMSMGGPRWEQKRHLGTALQASAVVLRCSSKSNHFEEVCVPKVALPLGHGLVLVQVEDGSSLTKNRWCEWWTWHCVTFKGRQCSDI